MVFQELIDRVAQLRVQANVVRLQADRDRRQQQRANDRWVTGGVNWGGYSLEDLIGMVASQASPKQLDALADEWRTHGTSIATASTDLQKSMDTLMNYWTGTSADTARQTVTTNAAWVSEMGDTAQQMARPIQDAGGALQSAQSTMPGKPSDNWWVGAGGGAAAGFMVGGPIGAAFGAAIGGIASAFGFGSSKAKLKRKAVQTMQRYETALLGVDGTTPQFGQPSTGTNPGTGQGPNPGGGINNPIAPPTPPGGSGPILTPGGPTAPPSGPPITNPQGSIPLEPGVSTDPWNRITDPRGALPGGGRPGLPPGGGFPGGPLVPGGGRGIPGGGIRPGGMPGERVPSRGARGGPGTGVPGGGRGGLGSDREVRGRNRLGTGPGGSRGVLGEEENARGRGRGTGAGPGGRGVLGEEENTRGRGRGPGASGPGVLGEEEELRGRGRGAGSGVPGAGGRGLLGEEENARGRGRGYGAGGLGSGGRAGIGEEAERGGRGRFGRPGVLEGHGAGGYGAPGGGGARGEEDEEHVRKFPVEEDPFTTDLKAAPPVIGI